MTTPIPSHPTSSPQLSTTLTIRRRSWHVWLQLAVGLCLVIANLGRLTDSLLEFGVDAALRDPAAFFNVTNILVLVLVACGGGLFFLALGLRKLPACYYDIEANVIRIPTGFGQWERVYPRPGQGQSLVFVRDSLATFDQATGKYRYLPIRRAGVAKDDWEALRRAVMQHSTSEPPQEP